MAVGMAPPPPTAAALPSRRRLRERIQSERQVVGGLLKKAEALVARAKEDVHGGRAAAAHSEACALPRRGRFLRRPEARPEAEATAAMDGAASPRKKRRKAATSASSIVEVEVIEPTMPKAQRDRLYGLLSSLSAEMPLPPHIVALMQSQCCCVVDPNGEEMDVDLGSAKDAALFQLLNLLEEFAQQQTTKIQPRLAEEQEPPKIEAPDATSRSSSICQLMEDGEVADEGADMDMDICGGVSPLVVDKAQFSPLPKQEEDDELINTSGGGGFSLQSPPAKQQEEEFVRDASPVAVDKFPQTESPSSSTGSSSGSSSSSSSSGGSSGSSCSGCSSSGSDSNDDGDSASSRPDNSELPTEAAAKPLEQQQVTVCGGGVSPLIDEFSPLPKQQEDDELIDVTGGVSPVSVNKFPDSPRSSSSGSSSSSSSGSSSSSSESDSDDDGDSASSKPDTADHPTEAEAPKLQPLEQHEVAEQDKKLIAERAASPNTEMQELIARAQERQKLRLELERKTARELERKMAREQLQEMERTARPVYDSIDPRVMKQLGISGDAQYIVSPVKSRHSLHRRGGGGLLQKLGFFLKE
jgi:uncharacterized membrane protein YgcG